jgi:hypothetical protein
VKNQKPSLLHAIKRKAQAKKHGWMHADPDPEPCARAEKLIFRAAHYTERIAVIHQVSVLCLHCNSAPSAAFPFSRLVSLIT